MTFENDPYLGGIKITSTKKKSSIGSVTEVKIYRKSLGQSWEYLKSIEISSANDLNFSFLDIAVASGKDYMYYVDILADTSIVETQTYDAVSCWFEGLFIGNDTGSYMAGTNVEINETINTQVEYVTTLSSRTPFRVSNTNVNYSTVDVSALFMKLSDDKKKFIVDKSYDYLNKVIAFLTDGTGKIIKYEDGRIWYASIDAAIVKPFNDRYIGNNGVQFSFTEIGDVPTFDYVIDIGVD